MTTEAADILGQSAPSALTLTDIYTVPAGKRTVISSIAICNRDGAVTINTRVSFAIGGAADTAKQYLYHGLPVPPVDTFIATIGVTLGAGVVVRVYTDVASASFQLFGVEITP